MGRERLSDTSYRKVAETVKRDGSATRRAEQRHQLGEGLNALVDPKGFGVIRRSLTRYVEVDGRWEIPNGIAMLEETLFDTTGSMGRNVDVAFKVLPTLYRLLSAGDAAVLRRYDLQVMTSIFGDVYADAYALQRSQAEMDQKIAEAMTYFVPERSGGDFTEDPEFGLFGAAYLTSAMINRYGLKWYHFMLGDANGRGHVEARMLKKVFGPDVFEKVAENGFQLSARALPDTEEIVRVLLTQAHAFFLQVDQHSCTTRFWTEIYGRERVIQIANTNMVPFVQAAVIGLTEGVLGLQDVAAYLENEGVSKREAQAIARSVAHIPLGAQAALPNFNRIPLSGAVFANKGDLWPIAEAETAASFGNRHEDCTAALEKDEDDMWL